jgi:hypothetical protein
MNDNHEFLVDVAKLIARHDMTIAEFYSELGVDLENYRVDAGHEVAKLAGIFTGWQTAE